MNKKFWQGAFMCLCVSGMLWPHQSIAQNKATYSSLADASAAGRKLKGKSGPKSVNWINGGNQYSFIEGDSINIKDPATLKERNVFISKGITLPGSSTPFAYESFQWSKDAQHLVFKTNFRRKYRRSGVSDYYIYDLANKQLKVAAKNARSAELSPDGTKVGIERDGNMFVYSFATGQEQQLTHDSTSENGIFNGHGDWVYEEELEVSQAWNWSPDNKYMAFWQFDDSKVPDFQMTNFEGQHPNNIHIAIPQVGDPNPKVRVGVIDVNSGKKVWLSPDETGDFYIPRLYWTSDPDILAMVTLNRAQNDMKLYFFNVKTGDHHVVLEEKNTTWVAISNFYTNVNDMLYFPEKTKEFFWVSDRSGFYHIYRYNYDGKLINQVTKGNWDMIKVSGINPDNKTIYYLSAEASPLEQQFYSIKYDGSDKKRLNPVPGFHDIDMSPNTKYYIDKYSNTTTPTQVALCNDKGKTLQLLEVNKGVSDFLATHAYSPLELFHFKAEDGTELDGSMIKPFNFDPTKKYPVVLSIYGGPESHGVFNRFSDATSEQWLAQNGYIVVNVNNRGIANYGSAFMKVVYKQLGKYESYDFAATARYMATQPFVDGKNMAIMGGSYGGYITAYTLLTHPGVFKVGIANSPVTDWRLYDDIYTERYMGTVEDNAEGYKNSSNMTHASGLQDHLLLIHSLSDDNVHPANTMQLLTALTNAGKDADLRIYPPGAHGAGYNPQSRLLINEVSFYYLERYLKGNTDLPNLNAK
ncbi:dipeptidyl-peptidase-4 [Mucilaginibacter mallensis]|uniref:Dipeptidyl-peptidase-4 n=1 Tax=Mucilaginibacter mallensis TaxID=652787 RepID=A0A1H1TUI6_MUCMA|nr:S9 family peptidase [Mucilaginibacter mallensis]SDS63596.1 dipeptidyl-peptidase-4 [Mucilaginibacter mallensis]